MGFLRNVQLERSYPVREAMIDYVVKLFQSSLDTSWEVARGANAVVFQSMEQERLDWGKTAELDRLLSLYTQRVHVTDHNTRTQSAKKLVCTHFNTGRCVQEGDHQRMVSYTGIFVHTVFIQ